MVEMTGLEPATSRPRPCALTDPHQIPVLNKHKIPEHKLMTLDIPRS